MINEMHLLLQDLAMPCRVRNKDKRLDDRFIPYLQWFVSAVVVVVVAAVVVFYSLFYPNRPISVLIIS
jgi:cell division septal protein FtsQ